MEKISVFVLEKNINYNYPFILIELIQNTCFKVRFADYDPHIVKEKYFFLKNIVNNPIIIVNCFVSDVCKFVNNPNNTTIIYL